jgi:hypothetical protein
VKLRRLLPLPVAGVAVGVAAVVDAAQQRVQPGLRLAMAVVALEVAADGADVADAAAPRLKIARAW